MPTFIEPLWTASDVATYLQVSLSWVRHATAEGSLPHHRIGHNVRYEPEAIRAWITSQRSQAARVVPSRQRALTEKTWHLAKDPYPFGALTKP